MARSGIHRLRTSALDGLAVGLLSAILGPGVARAQPSNDHCAQAQDISAGVHDFTTIGATNDGTATCGASATSPDVWFRVVTPADGGCEFTTCLLTKMDTVLSAYTECDGIQLICLDDSCGLQTSITVPSIAGVPTLFRVAGFNGETGSGQVMLTFIPAEPPTVAFGLPHTALGNASLTVSPKGDLIVGNIGSSGEDGVSVDLGESDYYKDFFDPLQAGELLPGARMNVRTYGRINGVPDQLRALLHIEVLPDNTMFSVTADLTRLLPDAVCVISEDLDGNVLDQRLFSTVPQVLATYRPETCQFCLDQWFDADVVEVLEFPEQTAVTIAGSTEHQNVKRILIIAKNAIPCDFLNRVDITLSDVPELHVFQQWVGSLGRTVNSLGAANLEPGGTTLGITNIGSSGQDGVSIDLDGAAGGTVSYMLNTEPIDPAGQGSGAVYKQSASGCSNIFPFICWGMPMDGCSFELFPIPMVQGSGLAFDPDLSNAGATSFRVEVYNMGSLVSSASGHTGRAAVVSAPPEVLWPRSAGMESIGANLVVMWPGIVQITVPGSAPVMGNEIRVIGENPTMMLAKLTKVDVTVENLDLIRFTQVVMGPPPTPCPCDWNQDNILNSQDFFDLVNQLFAGDADFNGDGVTNSQDFFDFLNCFFTPPEGCA